MKIRKIDHILRNPAQPGFLGKGHTATAVIGGRTFAQNDPFILLMDDQVDLPGGKPAGGPHPHAGFETVTLVLEGNGMGWERGSLEVMTAGSGIVHTEEITAKTKVRILQLWLVLPPEKRWAKPFWQELVLENVPIIKNDGLEIRVYSGGSHGLISPLQNQTPFTLIDFQLGKNMATTQELPSGYNGFIYVTNGSVIIGEKRVTEGETAWLEEPSDDDLTEVSFKTEDQGARFILYAGQPQNAPIVSHGPFIGDTQEDIARLYKAYRQGELPHLNTLPDSQKLKHELLV
jgi:redox-sensitive bicupin YhaK (pirin superfamily)